MNWLNTKELYTDGYITIIPVIRGANPRITAADARIYVRENRISLQVLFRDDYEDEIDYVWHTRPYEFSEEEINAVLAEVHQ